MLDFLQQHSGLIIAGLIVLLELAGIATAVHAVMRVRTAQGAVAWLIALVMLPIIALPLYAVFGRRRFTGYVDARRAADTAIESTTRSAIGDHSEQHRSSLGESDSRYDTFERLAGAPFLGANDVSLLVDGEATFRAVFEAMQAAEKYLLVQFYIIRDDDAGQALKQHMLDCLARGLRVYLLYDAVGSYQLSSDYITELTTAGASVNSFTGSTRRVQKLQVNFRNHRKIVVVDGHTAFVGGHNVGNEYLGRDPRLSPWRDTHVMVHGPAATAIQIPFAHDWYWASNELPVIDWSSTPGNANHAVLSLPTSPTDELERGALLFVHAIQSARERLWIVSPYFVPNGSVIDALKLAALRGVDVRILLPENADSRVVQLAGHAYVPELLVNGVRIFRYTRGFLHEKVMLIDRDIATIGTANLDNRSMRLNFEITLVFAGVSFTREVENMLTTDFAAATEVNTAAIDAQPWWFRAAASGARLFSPVL